MLCLEVENTGETDLDVGFTIEKVDVKVGGEGANAVLIGWGEGRDTVFPLSIASREQYNLLYAVSFLRSPEEVQGLTSLSVNAYGRGEHSDGQLQRSVTINIFGKALYARFPRQITPDEYICIKVELCFGSFHAKEPSRDR